eukprot:1160724-Pelagomonas_calceolata.AAC.6
MVALQSTQTCHCARIEINACPQRSQARRRPGSSDVPGQAQARQLEWADLAAFPYFNAALKESMRLHTAAALGTFRKVVGRSKCAVCALMRHWKWLHDSVLVALQGMGMKGTALLSTKERIRLGKPWDTCTLACMLLPHVAQECIDLRGLWNTCALACMLLLFVIQAKMGHDGCRAKMQRSERTRNPCTNVSSGGQAKLGHNGFRANPVTTACRPEPASLSRQGYMRMSR